VIGLDTNVVLRLMLVDDTAPHQAALVRQAVSTFSGQVFIGPLVLAELVWVIARKLQFSRSRIADLVDKLLKTPGIEVAEAVVVAEAIQRFRKGGPGFVDHLIASMNTHAGCRTTLTFDAAASKSLGFTLLTGAAFD
jgi:predicted nucleic-acid-binding protein